MRGRLQDSDGETRLNIAISPDMNAGDIQYKKYFIQNDTALESGYLEYAITQFALSDLFSLLSWALDPDTLSCPFNVVATLQAGGSLTAYTKYYYRITAFNSLGETTGCIEVNATTTDTDLSIKLNWSELEGADGYLIYRSTNQDYTNARVAVIEDPATIEWTDTGQAPDPSGPYSFPGINTDFDLPDENTTAGEAPDYGTPPDSGDFNTDNLVIGVLEPGQQKSFWLKVTSSVSTPQTGNPRKANLIPSED